jgi:hypothetical protein
MTHPSFLCCFLTAASALACHSGSNKPAEGSSSTLVQSADDQSANCTLAGPVDIDVSLSQVTSDRRLVVEYRLTPLFDCQDIEVHCAMPKTVSVISESPALRGPARRGDARDGRITLQLPADGQEPRIVLFGSVAFHESSRQQVVRFAFDREILSGPALAMVLPPEQRSADETSIDLPAERIGGAQR